MQGHILVFKNLERIPPQTCIIHVRIRHQCGNRAAAEFDRTHLYGSVHGDVQHCHASVSSHILVLLTDAFLQHIELDVASFFRHCLELNVFPAEVMQRRQ